MKIHRRDFLRNSLGSAFALSFRAAVTGLPASFLFSRSVHAVNESARFTIISGSAGGEAMNANSPGTYANPQFADDLANRIMHPDPNQVGAATTRVINGRTLTAQDLANGVDLNFGANVVRSARAYSALEQSFLNNLVCFWHRSGTNAHTEFSSVLQAHGALKGVSGNGNEQLPAAIAQEMAPLLNTAIAKPFVISGNHYRFNGVPLNQSSPRAIKNLMASNNAVPVSGDNFGALYNATIDEVYRDVKTNGTTQQRRFLDLHASSRSQAIALGDQLGSLLNSINGDGQIDQFLTAAALVMVKLAPVIVVQHRFSGDNHNDTNLTNETQQTFEALAAFDGYWKILKTYGLTDSVIFATCNVFGRTVVRNGSGGRDHYGDLTCGFIHGANLRGGMVGGLEAGGRNGVRAASINPNTGRVGAGVSADISGTDTLAAFTKTILAAAGVPESRQDVRMPDARVVTSIFS